jgi:hypothetical protein
MHTGFWLEIKKERDHQEDVEVGGMINIKIDLWRNMMVWYELDSSGSG